MIDEEILFILTNELTGQASEEEIERLNDWLLESSENEALCYAYKQAFLNGKFNTKGKANYPRSYVFSMRYFTCFSRSTTRNSWYVLIFNKQD